MRLLCFCDCGRTKINKIDHLKGGDVKSCGCLDIGEDSHSYFKRHPEYADSDCFFYIAELDNEHLKVGISNDLKVRKRGSHGNYREYLFERKLNRSECWTIEQIILHETLDAKPSTTPKKFKNMKGGKQEIRIKNKYSLNFYRNKYFELLEKMTELGGWEDLYLNRFNYKKGVLGRKFESFRPESNNPSHRVDPQPVFFNAHIMPAMVAVKLQSNIPY